MPADNTFQPSKSSSPLGKLEGADSSPSGKLDGDLGFGIYIHIPFCKQACHYCDFHFSTSLKKKHALVEALKDELILRKHELANIPVRTIYFGGGTPSLLPVDDLKSLIDTVFQNYRVIEHPEITLEANPDDLIRAKGTNGESSIYELYKSIGINRLSIGIQSFHEHDLKLMNRAHDQEEAKSCLEEAVQHFDDISVDLIYGIQGLSNEKWLENIDMALSFGITHISSYALTVEPQTALASFIEKGIIDDVDDAQAEEQFSMLMDRLAQNGFIHYEISNFGKQGYFSQNNSAYWQGKPYLGIGPSAHSFDGKKRSWNVRNNSKYIEAIEKRVLPSEEEILTTTDAYNEYVMTGLRTIWGVDLEVVNRRFGPAYKDHLLKQSQPYIKRQLLYLDEHLLTTTAKGKFLCDGIASELFKIKLA